MSIIEKRTTSNEERKPLTCDISLLQNIPLCEIVPDHDDGRGDNFGKHIPDSDDIDEEPHDQLIDAKAHDGGEDEEKHLPARLVFRVEHHVDAEDIVYDQGYGKGDGGGNQGIKACEFRQGKEEEIFQQKAGTAYHEKTENFPESFCGGKEF